MKRVVFTLFAIVFAVVGVGISAEEKPADIDGKKLVGKWEVQEGEVKATVEFGPKGEYKVIFTAGDLKGKGFEGKYKVEGNKLITSYKLSSGRDHEGTSTIIKLTDDEMQEQDGREVKGKKIVTTLKRIKEDKK